MMYPIPPVNTFGKDNCAYWEDFLTKEEIEYLSNIQSEQDIMPATIGMSSNPIIDKSIRSTKLAWLEPNEHNYKIWDKFAKVIAEVNSRFFHYDLTGFYEPMQLGIYAAEDNGHYDWHIDMYKENKDAPRKLSMVLMLSDPSDFEGGKLLIKTDRDEPRTLDMIKGRAWFFPSYMLHKVTPVTKGIRKTLVLWVGGPPFK